MNSIFGKCGTDKLNPSTVFNLFMDESFGVTLDFKFNNKRINLNGTFDRKLCEMKGNLKAT